MSPGMEKVTQGVGKPAVEGGERRSCWIQPNAPPLRTVTPAQPRRVPLWREHSPSGAAPGKPVSPAQARLCGV